MGEDEVKLIGNNFSSFVMRPRIALNLKGVKYEFLLETLGQKSELLLESNPALKKIPVLIHNGKPVCESLIIVQYIDEAWTKSGPAIMPSDAYDRAIHRFWAYFVDDKLFPSITGIFMTPNEEAKAESIQQLKANLKLLEEVKQKYSEGKPFFGGHNIGLLDIAFGSMLGGIKATEKLNGLKLLDIESVPSLVEWADRFCGHESVKEVMPEMDKLIEYAETNRARIQGATPPK